MDRGTLEQGEYPDIFCCFSSPFLVGAVTGERIGRRDVEPHRFALHPDAGLVETGNRAVGKSLLDRFLDARAVLRRSVHSGGKHGLVLVPTPQADLHKRTVLSHLHLAGRKVEYLTPLTGGLESPSDEGGRWKLRLFMPRRPSSSLMRFFSSSFSSSKEGCALGEPGELCHRPGLFLDDCQQGLHKLDHRFGALSLD